ncbi:glutamate synthase small subunit [Phycisphaera mikurensis NBRC 102666]|uniref:Glutamate synthase small subunit n=1 Tax=Phycisphaera mikurensis (strain NBRC 102666 / KCTC 22515 / FYK2301M01) TaxID=1142394 RepID=I0IG15_PHYMF|nr:glutamate synthase small subunit [Phycisphaera mikurensis NBRC 102666]
MRAIASPPPTTSRDIRLRLADHAEVAHAPCDAEASAEGERCMSCGAAFCMPSGGYASHAGGAAGCPIGNRIPEWNELVSLGRWEEAYANLAETNNFPEFTGRLCPAPCQDACIHGLNERPVGIKSIERAIIDKAFARGWVRQNTPAVRLDTQVGIVGSGPAGLAAADQLNQAGHRVTVFERADRVGGLLVYGVPSMKLEKAVVARRVALLERAGVRFRTRTAIGEDVRAEDLAAEHDAVLVAAGAVRGRRLRIPGADLPGVEMAMPYLESATRHWLDGEAKPIDAAGRDVVIIGGGDTGADCIATALRQGCRSVVNITRRDRPPAERDAAHPWPGPPDTYTLDYAHAEGAAVQGADPRAWGVTPVAFEADGAGRLAGLRVRRCGRDEVLPAQLAVLSIGFVGTDHNGWLTDLGFSRDRPASAGNQPERSTRFAHVFACGDCRRGPSLVVHAIAEGRAAAAVIDGMLRKKPHAADASAGRGHRLGVPPQAAASRERPVRADRPPR